MKMNRRLATISIALLVSLWSGTARATTFTVGNNPQQDEQNIFLNTGTSGSTVSGVTSTSGTTVNFSSSTDTLNEPSNGQARIEAADGLLNQLTITVPGGSFDAFIFNLLNASGTAVVSAVANTPGGPSTSTFNFVLGNGSNFLTVTADPGETLASLSISAPGGADDFRQPRIVVEGISTTAAPVPEPASLVLLGSGLAFVGNRLRRKKAEAR